MGSTRIQRVGWRLLLAPVVAFASVVAACSPQGPAPEDPTIPAQTPQPNGTAVVDVGDQTVTLAVPEGQSITASRIDLVGLPPVGEDLDPTVGVMSLRVEGVAVGTVTRVTVTLPSPVETVKKLIDGAWEVFAHDGTTGGSLSTDGLTLTLDLQDGGRGDLDGIADGVIVDPIAPGRILTPPSLPPSLPPSPSPEPAAPTGSGEAIHFVVDVSGSMSGSKLVAAQDALKAVVAGVPETTATGLRSYSGGCTAQSTVAPLVPIGVGNNDAIIAAADSLRAGGGTPTTAALEEGIAELEAFSTSGSKRLVLLTDGDTGCGISVCDYVRGWGQTQVSLTLYTVGLQVSAGAAADLTCAAELTGGRYISAESPDDLLDALNEVSSGGSAAARADALARASMLEFSQWLDQQSAEWAQRCGGNSRTCVRVRERLATLNQNVQKLSKVAGYTFLYFDGDENQFRDGTDDTRVVLYRGEPSDLSSAQNVSFFVPGTSTTWSSGFRFDGAGATVKNTNWVSSADAIGDQASAVAPSERTVSVAWLGYDAPDGQAIDIVFGGGPNRAIYASEGAVLLAQHVREFTRASQHVTLVGHSYGSLVTGYALWRENLQDVDDWVGGGAPGLGVSKTRRNGAAPCAGSGGDASAHLPSGDVDHSRQCVDELGESHFWAMQTQQDWLIGNPRGWKQGVCNTFSPSQNCGSLMGDLPHQDRFGAHEMHTKRSGRPDISEHGDYFRLKDGEAPESLVNTARVVVGRYSEVTLEAIGKGLSGRPADV